MLILPKIAIKDGASLHQFDGAVATPADIAAQFVKAGFSWLYIQSQDASIDEECIHTLRQIIDAVDVPVIFEGAFISLTQVDQVFAEGISRVVLNNIALSDHNFIQDSCAHYPDQIAMHLHSDGGKVDSGVAQFDLGKIGTNIHDYGAYAIFYSYTQKQSNAMALDIDDVIQFSKTCSAPLFFANDVDKIEDLLSIATIANDHNIAGILIGESFYNGAIDAAHALQIGAGLSLYQQKSNDN